MTRRAVGPLDWLYAVVLWLYPSEFRRRYAAEMRLAFRDRLRAAARRGPVVAVKTACGAFVDAIAHGLLERFANGEAAPVESRSGETIMRELRIAIRRLMREPGFSAVVVITLALGIGAATTIFSVVEAVLLRPLPYRDADRLLTVRQWSKAKGIEEAPSPANFLDWRDAAQRVELAAAEPYGLDLTGSGDPIGLDTWRVSERYFETLGVTPLTGRTFHSSEHVKGRDRVVILSHALWQTRFGGDRQIVGRTLILDDAPYEVVGVLPPHIDFPSRSALWVPKVFGDAERKARLQTYYSVVARLKADTTKAQAVDELSAIAARLAVQYPRTNKDVGVRAVAIFEQVTGSVRPILLLILGAVGCVLVVSCANAANLLLARAAARQGEMAVRTALGAGRRDLLRVTLAESAVLTVCAAACGLAVSRAALTVIVRLAPADLPRLDEVSVNLTVLAFAIALATATAVICGLAPAIQFWSRSIEGALRTGSRTSAGAGSRFRATLVAGQTALAVMLLVVNGLLVRSFGALLQVDLGYRVDHRVALSAHVWDLYPQPERRTEFFAELEQRVLREPGIAAVGAASALPLSHEGSEMDPPFTVVGQPVPAPGDEPTALVTFVTPGYFGAIGMRLAQGRLFTDQDSPATTPVVVINETMARRIWPGENPIGRRIVSRLSFAGSNTREVVGVVGDVRQGGLEDRPAPAYYVPHRQVPFGSMTFIARTNGEAASAVPIVQRAAASINPRVSFTAVETLDRLLNDTLAPRRFTMTLLSAFSVAALALATVGLYGLTSFAVSRRTAEIGIRMALGADRGSVRALILRQGLMIAAAGVACGFAAALLVSRFLGTMLFGISAIDPPTFATLAVVMTLASAAACYVPARRATRVDPLRAIRTE